MPANIHQNAKAHEGKKDFHCNPSRSVTAALNANNEPKIRIH